MSASPWLVVAACALAATGCGRQERRRAACDARAIALGARLTAAVTEAPVGLTVPPELTAIESSAGARVDRSGPMVVIDRAGAVTLYGRPVSLERELLARLEPELAGAPGPLPLYVASDAGAPVAVVQAVLAGLPERLEPRLLMLGPAPPPDPYFTALAARPAARALMTAIRDAPPSDRAAELARRIEAAVAGCAALEEVFGSVAGAENKAAHLAAATPEALRRCGCRAADLDLVEFALLTVFGAGERPARWLPLRPLEVGAARTAGELAAALAAQAPK